MVNPFKTGPGQTLRFAPEKSVTPEVTAGPPPPPPPPVVDFTGTPLIGQAPLPVDFTDLSTGNPTAWLWQFGDSAPNGTDQNPNHVYQNPGVYSVSLAVTGPGGTQALVKPNYVTVLAPPQRVWADPYIDDVYVRITGGSLIDMSPANTAVTAFGGSAQIAPGQGIHGLDALRLSSTTGYLRFASPSNMNGTVIPMTVEARFKPTDYANWTICGPSDGNKVFSVLCEGNVLKYGLGNLIDDEWGEVDLTMVDPAIISPTVLGADGFWHVEVSVFLLAGIGLQNLIKLNGRTLLPNITRSGSAAIDTSGMMALGMNAFFPALASDILLDEFRIRRGHALYGYAAASNQTISRYAVNPVRWSNSNGLGLGWDVLRTGRYNGSVVAPPVLEFVDANRTVVVGYDTNFPGPTANGVQGFAETKRVVGGKRYFEIVVNWWSTQTNIGVFALPLGTPLDQTTPYAPPGDYYQLEISDGGAGSCGSYFGFTDTAPVIDNFFNTAPDLGTYNNDTFGFFVDLDAGRIDKVVRNGTQDDAAPLGGARINTKYWEPGWKVVPYFNARPGGEGMSALLITAGEFRYPPTGPDAVYLPWDPAPPLPPEVDFVGTPLTGTAPLTVDFTDLTVGTPTSWLWAFGDNTSSNVQNPTKTYNDVGMYSVTLAATNSSGTDAEFKLNYIEVTAPPSTANFALFGGGMNSVDVTKGTTKYGWLTDVTSFGTDLQRFRSSFNGMGNLVKGVFVGGSNNSTQSETYTYADDTVTGGAFLIGAGQGPKGVSNSTVGIVNSGAKPSAPTTATQRYTLVDDTMAAGVGLSQVRYYAATFGDAFTGYFGSGSVSNAGSGTQYATTDMYQYASDAVALGTDLNLSSADSVSLSGPSYGLVTLPYGPSGAGIDYSTKRYDYLAQVVTPGTNLARARYGTYGTSNQTRGLIAGGYQLTGPGGMTNAIETYAFATNVVGIGTNLASVLVYAAAVSTNPGGI